MPSAFDVVMDSRKELVQEILKNLEKGYLFTKAEWNSAALRPHNPVSDARYKGGNRLRLMHEVLKHQYTDPRWLTFRQITDSGYHLKKGSKGMLCEKWIFEKTEKVRLESGEVVEEVKLLDTPRVNYFVVFNGQQVDGLPEFVVNPNITQQVELLSLADELIKASECPILELGQDEAFYMPGKDRIVLPVRTSFKDGESFVKTLLHEMSHSTGHASRLNRGMKDPFGSKEYAKEELRAEIAALFLETDLGLCLQAEHFTDHTNYIGAWLKILKEDTNELFRACKDAEAICARLYQNLMRYREMERGLEEMKNAELEKGKEECYGTLCGKRGSR